MSERCSIEAHFPSLDVCLEHLNTHYRQSVVTIEAKDIDNGEPIRSFEAPKYFYRGENTIFHITSSRHHRVKYSREFNDHVRDEIAKVIRDMKLALMDFLHIEAFHALAYLQHYGFATELIDISSGIDTAAFFASYENPSTENETGMICVFETEKIYRKASVIDLTNHPRALRPRLQKAYGFRSEKHWNIKSDDAIKDLELKWFSFNSTKEEKLRYFKSKQNEFLPPAIEDVTAGRIYTCLLSLGYKVTDKTADFTVNRYTVPGVPIMIDTRTGLEKTFFETDMSYDESIARYNLYRVLSNQYRDTYAKMSGFDPMR
jgi:hypothetical protein